jgi:hypothetical protein
MKKDYFEEHRKRQAEKMTKAGLVNLTENQMALITEPSDSPESYYCDGELTPGFAFNNWINRLRKSGLKTKQIDAAIKINFK